MANQSDTTGAAFANASQAIGKMISTTLKGIDKEVATRSYQAANELRNASTQVLRGTRSGRPYKLPNSRATYRASRAGESPAVRTGAFRSSWGTHIHVEKSGVHFKAAVGIESKLKAGGALLGDILENGRRGMDPRPYKDKVIAKALPQIKIIYSKSYNV